MHVLTEVWQLEKFGNTPEEYEDAFCPEQTNQEADVFRAAVADGATETSFSRQWASLLVRAFCDGQFANDALFCTIRELQQQWLMEVSAKTLPWYAEEKLQMGAYSSLIGLTLKNEGRQWEAVAIGDSCLFQVREEKLIGRWPLGSSTEFNNCPILLSTKPESNEDFFEQPISGEWVPGDLFFLMTDAIAKWYLQTVEQGGSPIDAIPDFSSLSFSNWIADMRSSGQMRNDDVTLMCVHVN